MAEIDISTHKLAEDTVRAMKGQFTLEDVLAVWHSLGRSVYQNLVMKKGVKLTSLGTFSLNRSEQPIFVMSSALAQKFKIKQADQTMPENIPVTIINFSQLTEGTLSGRYYNKNLTARRSIL